MAKDFTTSNEDTQTKNINTEELLRGEILMQKSEIDKDQKSLISSKNKKIKLIEKKALPESLEFNLDALFKDEKELENFAKELDIKLQEFNDAYAGKLSMLQADDFSNALQVYDSLSEGLGAIMTYVFLKFAVDSKTYGALYADYELKCNAMYAKVMFFELEFADLDSVKMNEFIAKNDKYSFFLQNIEATKKYKLSLKEEQILLNVAPVGVDAFSRLFDESFANMRFKGVVDDEKIGEEEILGFLHVDDRKLRKLAQKNFTKGLRKNSHLLTYILNMVRKDVAITQKLRGYEKPESFRHISNQTTQASVDSMIDCVNANMQLVHGYYRVKAQFLGHKLKDYDRYAPLGLTKNGKKTKVEFQDALYDTLESFYNFSPRFYEIAKEAVFNGWIDSHPKPTKRGGAFSHGSVPSAHPYVMLNFTGNRRDAFTIAHELGHAIHQELSKIQGTLNHDTPLTTAETASVFAEMLLFDSMKKTLKGKELLEIYAGKIEDIFSTLFRQIVMTNFERAIHEKEGELKSEDFDKIWLDENKKMFGNSVYLTKKYAKWWSYIPHFIHSPFYCYAYSYGQLLVLALFGLYKRSEDKEKFIQTYIDFLSAGGSKSPRDLILTFGFDVNESAFWEIGMNEVKNLLKEFEDLLNSTKL
ncbi:M3 family oligoendopeptidase [Helicobacter trogontum]|uniref:Oligoendopeptidase F n=2 Tax=Helicobacter trogontum TaxID=50960 RepID=A0A4U8SAM1_9HELI|nr:M3 family oligoendopeptidase [Helicobacter trogontum]TLD83084.1 oligoendopeptidase F [Helicobacter trogontum]